MNRSRDSLIGHALNSRRSPPNFRGSPRLIAACRFFWRLWRSDSEEPEDCREETRGSRRHLPAVLFRRRVDRVGVAHRGAKSRQEFDVRSRARYRESRLDDEREERYEGVRPRYRAAPTKATLTN